MGSLKIAAVNGEVLALAKENRWCLFRLATFFKYEDDKKKKLAGADYIDFRAEKQEEAGFRGDWVNPEGVSMNQDGNKLVIQEVPIDEEEVKRLLAQQKDL